MTLHSPIRPQWTCAGCGDGWPCGSRRAQLRAEYAAADLSLALYLAACMVDAAYDMPHTTGGELYARFLGWIRR